MTPPGIYLAGPEVFLPDAREIGQAKRAICARHGLTGRFPLDDTLAGADRIFASNLDLIRGADGVIANLTPFRGPSADPGTAFELGFAAALGRPVFGYTNVGGELIGRVPPDGMAIEDFGLFDNLMLAEALAATGGVIHPATPVADPSRDLAAFASCVARAARRLLASPP